MTYTQPPQTQSFDDLFRNQHNLQHAFNVQAYGADPYGTNDSTNAIQAAINACVSAGGGTVFCPAGTYRVSASLVLKGGVHLVGVGGDVGSVFGDTLTGSVIKVTGVAGFDAVTLAAGTHKNVSIRRLFFDVTTDSSHWVINLASAPAGLILREIGIRQSGTGANGIQLDGGTTGIFGAFFENIGINSGGGFTGGVGIRFGNTSPCNAVAAWMLQLGGYTTGIDFNNGGGNTVVEPWIQSCTTGIRFNSSQDVVVGGWYETLTTALSFTAASVNALVIGGRQTSVTTPVSDSGTGTQVIAADGTNSGVFTAGSFVSSGSGSLAGLSFVDRSGSPTWIWYGNSAAHLWNGSTDVLTIDPTSGFLQVHAQVYPGAEAQGLQASGGFLHSTGVPSNSNGNNNDWCISDNGHLYFKSAGSWVQKV